MANGEQAVEQDQRIMLRVYCEVEVAIDDPEAVQNRAEQELREADIDWPTEPDTLDEAVAELRGNLAQSLASLVEPYRMLDGVPGVSMMGGRCWAEPRPATTTPGLDGPPSSGS